MTDVEGIYPPGIRQRSGFTHEPETARLPIPPHPRGDSSDETRCKSAAWLQPEEGNTPPVSRAQIAAIASVSAASVAFAYRNVVSIRLCPHRAMMDLIGTPASASHVA